MVIGHVIEDSGKRADAEWIMVGDGDVVLRGLLACQPNMAARLPRDAVTKSCQRFDELCPGNVPGKFHAGMTSSRT